MGGLLNIFVRATGEVTPCSALAFPECVVGNVHRDSLATICAEERCRKVLAWCRPETLTGACKMVERIGDLATHSFADLARGAQSRARPAHALPYCRDCALASLCGGGCRTENLEITGDAETPVCGNWRVRLSAELLAEDRPYALEWPVAHLLAEARARAIATPSDLSVPNQQ